MIEILKAIWKIIRGEPFLYKQDISSHEIKDGYFIKCNISKDNIITKSFMEKCDVDLKEGKIMEKKTKKEKVKKEKKVKKSKKEKKQKKSKKVKKEKKHEPRLLKIKKGEEL